jgi:hypothetical protein
MSIDFGGRLGEAEALNSLGDLLTWCPASHRPRDHRARALASTREISVPLEEARWKESASATFRDGNPGEGAARHGRHSPSTSASEPPRPGASRKPSALQHQENPGGEVLRLSHPGAP